MVFSFSQQKILIEYIMLDGVNDEEQHAHQLGKLLETLEVVSFYTSIGNICKISVTFKIWLSLCVHVVKAWFC